MTDTATRRVTSDARPESLEPTANLQEPDGPDPRMTGFWRTVVAAFTVAGVLLTMNQVFFWNVFGDAMLRQSYLYFTLTAFLSLVFIVLPTSKRPAHQPVRWWDVVLFAATIVVTLYLGLNGTRIIEAGWEYVAPVQGLVAGYLLWALVLEALRRAAGLIVMFLALVASLYPVVAGQVPVAILQGVPYDVTRAIAIHSMGTESILGLPLQTAASLIIGFLLFGVALQHTGGAEFFYKAAMSLFGKQKGGAAKVSVVSSGGLGMISGSAISNVLTTGPMTIPAMKKSGFSARYAAGVEATASTGGTITPPIMGTAAFLMVSFIAVPYREIVIAAAIPAVLFYLGIYLQVSAYSAKNDLQGLPSDQIPKLWSTVKIGWPHLAAVLLLIYLIVVQQNESQAPFYVIAFLLAVAFLRPSTGFRWAHFVDFLVSAGKTIAEILGIIAGVGVIIGSLSMTGVSLSLARELVNAVGGNLALILLAGALTSFILGMGMTVSAVYVLLAVVIAPAFVELGVNPIAGHLFVIYWATISWITPPVALAAFAASNIAGTPPMRTAFTAMRLGAVKYIVPFAFVVNPALVAQAPLPEVMLALVTGIVGVYLLASAFEGWLTIGNRRLTTIPRVLSAAAGLLLLWPALATTLVGGAIAVIVLVWSLRPGASRAAHSSGAHAADMQNA